MVLLLRPLSSVQAELPPRCPGKPLSLLCLYFPWMMSVPCRAELFWSESDRLLGPFSAAGAVGPDVTAAEARRGPMGVQEEEAPEGGKHPP